MIRISEERSGAVPVLRIEGALEGADVTLVERVYGDLVGERADGVVVDLTGLTFLGTDGAVLLRRLRLERGAQLQGQCLFTKQMIDEVEFEQGVSG
jgi:anti-anti-sigma regulatory factor